MTSDEPDDWRLVLDANILLQAPLRDTILRLAQARVVAVFWSATILTEVERNFARVSGPDEAQDRYRRLLDALRRHFPRALVAEEGEAQVAPGIAAHDRHVVACAIVGGAELVVTDNARHFFARRIAPHPIAAWHPDRLPRDPLAKRPHDLRAVLLAQGAELRSPRSLAQARRRYDLGEEESDSTMGKGARDDR